VDLAKIRKKAKEPASSGAAKKRPEPRRRKPSEEPEHESAQPKDLPPDPPKRPPKASASPEKAQPMAPAVEAPSEPANPESAPVQASAGEKLLIFDVEREKYAIPIHDIAQIIEMPATTPIPNAPSFLYGILSLRGKIVSIIDVASRLELKRRKVLDQGKIVVLDMGADHFGLLVDNIDQVVEVDMSSLEPPPEGFRPMAEDYVEGVFHHKRKAVAFLNLPMFLAFEI
jgi:purine-binding chemotaxis protein CheW